MPTDQQISDDTVKVSKMTTEEAIAYKEQILDRLENLVTRFCLKEDVTLPPEGDEFHNGFLTALIMAKGFASVFGPNDPDVMAVVTIVQTYLNKIGEKVPAGDNALPLFDSQQIPEFDL